MHINLEIPGAAVGHDPRQIYDNPTNQENQVHRNAIHGFEAQNQERFDVVRQNMTSRETQQHNIKHEHPERDKLDEKPTCRPSTGLQGLHRHRPRQRPGHKGLHITNPPKLPKEAGRRRARPLLRQHRLRRWQQRDPGHRVRPPHRVTQPDLCPPGGGQRGLLQLVINYT